MCWKCHSTPDPFFFPVTLIEKHMNAIDSFAQVKIEFVRIGGVRPVVGDAFIPLIPDEVDSLEARLSSRLPESYREFLLAYGAVGFNEYIDYRPVVDFPSSMTSTGTGHLSLLYGSESSEHEGYGLLTRMDYFAGRIPSWMLPIGDNGMVDQICLAISGKQAGKVFFWDQEDEPQDDDEYFEDYGTPMPSELKLRNVYLIAESFTDFMRRCFVSG